MKLYATTTSERASKGQGGKWVEIQITDENRKNILCFTIKDSKLYDKRWTGHPKPLIFFLTSISDKIAFQLYEQLHKDIMFKKELIKGKKQKGE